MNKTGTKTKILALVASAALVAMLGLAACSSGSSTTATSSADSGSAGESSAAAAASDSSAAANDSSAAADGSVSLSALVEELFQNCLVGQDDKNMLYFYAQGEDDKTASLLIYDMTNETFTMHTGAYEEPTTGTVRIDTKGAGEAVEFKVAPNAEKTSVDFTFANGSTVTMGPAIDEETEQMLQQLDQLIAQVNESAEAQ